MAVRVFISHSVADAPLAEQLVDLLRLALGLSAREIRCTSVPGSRLPMGSDVQQQIREELSDSRAFVALLTPSSLRSSYVLFEIGARWGRGQRMFPLFAAGARPSEANAWLAAFHGAMADSRVDLLQFLVEIAEELEIHPVAPAVYEHKLSAIADESQRAEDEFREEYGALDPTLQRSWELEMEEEDQKAFGTFVRFWNIANEYFVSHFRPSAGVDCPDSLEAMLEAAKAPPGATDGGDLVAWPERAVRRLGQDQRRLWRFVTAIYPPREGRTGDVAAHSGIKPEETADEFHRARRDLAGFFQEWSGKVGRRFIRTRFGSRLDYVLLLAWLELALVQWTRQPGLGKQRLLSLAEYMAR